VYFQKAMIIVVKRFGVAHSSKASPFRTLEVDSNGYPWDCWTRYNVLASHTSETFARMCIS
jgi:hypothetical protein